MSKRHPRAPSTPALPVARAPYGEFISALKDRVQLARVTAARRVNGELVLLYWDLGHAICVAQSQHGWGDAVVERIAADLCEAFPAMSGLSARNLWDVRRFYLACTGAELLKHVAADLAVHPPAKKMRQPAAELARSADAAPVDTAQQTLRQLAAEIPWGHHLLLLNKVTDPAAHLYYLRATAAFGWSRNVLHAQIRGGAFERARREKKTHNFALALPAQLAEQADEMMRARYSLEFLGIGRAVKERELEDRLIERLQQFILELGYGFCFVGRQYRLALGRKEYFVDLLFYHRFLKALVAFDLKIGSFEPEHAGKMDFYLNLLNNKERAAGDHPSIGIILCAEKDDVEVEFSLNTKTNPIGVAEYQLQSTLPAQFKGRLPTARQLAGALRDALSPASVASPAPGAALAARRPRRSSHTS